MLSARVRHRRLRLHALTFASLRSGDSRAAASSGVVSHALPRQTLIARADSALVAALAL